MNITDAQRDMREAYFGGGTGALASGLVWIIAGALAFQGSEKTAILAFLIGGMLIFPASIIISKLLGRSGKHDAANPFGQLALETTVMMLLGILIALAIFTANPLWFFPCMLLVIAGRYLTFATIYGLKLYWIFAAILALAGYYVYAAALPFHAGALMGGAIEIIFAPLLMMSSRTGKHVA